MRYDRPITNREWKFNLAGSSESRRRTSFNSRIAAVQSVDPRDLCRESAREVRRVEATLTVLATELDALGLANAGGSVVMLAVLVAPFAVIALLRPESTSIWPLAACYVVAIPVTWRLFRERRKR